MTACDEDDASNDCVLGLPRIPPLTAITNHLTPFLPTNDGATFSRTFRPRDRPLVGFALVRQRLTRLYPTSPRIIWVRMASARLACSVTEKDYQP